jgi:hypothetical protein
MASPQELKLPLSAPEFKELKETYRAISTAMGKAAGSRHVAEAMAAMALRNVHAEAAHVVRAIEAAK